MQPKGATDRFRRLLRMAVGPREQQLVAENKRQFADILFLNWHYANFELSPLNMARDRERHIEIFGVAGENNVFSAVV